jgi:hypothetical protein
MRPLLSINDMEDGMQQQQQKYRRPLACLGRFNLRVINLLAYHKSKCTVVDYFRFAKRVARQTIPIWACDDLARISHRRNLL